MNSNRNLKSQAATSVAFESLRYPLFHWDGRRSSLTAQCTWWEKSRELKEEKGVMPDLLPACSNGKGLSEGDKAKVARFYESDLVSRIFPGKKDFVSVTDENGARTHVQKRLILWNLKEIYEMYKGEETNQRMWFSTFACLRPKHCVLLGGRGRIPYAYAAIIRTQSWW